MLKSRQSTSAASWCSPARARVVSTGCGSPTRPRWANDPATESTNMSIGAFLGFRSAFSPTSSRAAIELASAERALRAAGLRPYREDPNPERVRKRYETLHKHSRSELDHSGSGSLRSLGTLAMQAIGERAGPLADLASCAELRLVPGSFASGLVAPELPCGRLWSTGAMLEALTALAPTLGVVLRDAELSDDVVALINNMEPLGEEDTGNLPDGLADCDYDLLEHHRPNWLLLFEFTRIAHEFQTALVLGG